MAGKRQASPESSLSNRAAQDKEYLRRLRVLSKAGVTPDPSNRKRVNAQFRKLIARENLEKKYTVPADKKTRQILKERGFATTKTGVLIDRPRFAGRHIKGSTIRITKKGDVVMTTKERRDIVVGFTKKEKKEFAKDPEAVIAKKQKELREKYPTLKRIRKIRTRLQWGIFSGQKDFSPYFFSARYFAEVSPIEKRRKEKTKRIDKLTGLHFIVHTTKKRAKKSKGKKHAKKSKGTKRRSRRS